MKKLLTLALATLAFTAIAQEKAKEGKTLENPLADEAREYILEGTEAMINQDENR